MTMVQYEINASSCRLYRLIVRSRAKLDAATLLVSDSPSKTTRGSTSSQSRSAAQSRRVATPSRHLTSE